MKKVNDNLRKFFLFDNKAKIKITKMGIKLNNLVTPASPKNKPAKMPLLLFHKKYNPMTKNIVAASTPNEKTELNIVLQLNKNNKEDITASLLPNFSFAILKAKNADTNVEIKGISFKIIILNPNILQIKAIK